MEDKVARWVRVWAAQNDTSVSQMLADMLKEKMDREQEYFTAREQFLGRNPVPLKQKGGYPSRDSLHER